MEKYYKKVLKTIEENGFVAYIVGGFVRDKILGIENNDIDIITNATPKDLNKIFNSIVKTYDKYGVVKLKIKNDIIDIATFRRELLYKDGKTDKIEYINSLEEDLTRRDFTINTLCLDKDGNIIDLLNARKDIENKKIKTIKPAHISFKEDPSRILRGIRFMCELDFELDKDIIKYIKENPSEIEKISYIKRKQELDRLFITNKVTKFLNFIKEYDLEKYLEIKSTNFRETNTIIGVWAQLEVSKNYPFSKNEKREIKLLKELLTKGEIDKYDLYKKGLYISSIAADILKINKKELNLIYTNLPIKGIIDIRVKPEDICSYLNITPGEKLGKILKMLEYEIVTGTLKNEKKEIIKRLDQFER